MPKIVVIGGSTGCIEPLKTILRGLPAGFPAAVLVVSHIGPRQSILPSILQAESAMPVRHAEQGEAIGPGVVLVAPPDVHLTVMQAAERYHVHLSRRPKENHCRPAIDPLFRSAATLFRQDAIGVILSGYLDDGVVGLQALKTLGGTTLVQDPDEAEVRDMPASALALVKADRVLPASGLAPALREAAGRTAAPVSRDPGAELVARENRMFARQAEPEELDLIGERSELTCPECHGPLWEVDGDGALLRYRCHVGHALSARVLEALQTESVEQALWGAVRALFEQEKIYQELHQKARQIGHGVNADEYLAKADQIRHSSLLLRNLIAGKAGNAEAAMNDF
jgi:two-component system chemotaxis response regulator CheB